MKTTLRTLKFLVLAGVLGLAASTSAVNAKKPAGLGSWNLDLIGGLSATAAVSFNSELRSGKEDVVKFVWRNVQLGHDFAETIDFIDGRFGDPDGESCFGADACAEAAVTLNLFEDGSAILTSFPECLTADGEEIQKYRVDATGTWSGVADLRALLAPGGAVMTATLGSLELTTEGKGQNRRRSCRGTFDTLDGFGATATATRP